MTTTRMRDEGRVGRTKSVLRRGRAILHVSVALGLYAAMGYSMRQEVQPPRAAATAASSPSDFPTMPEATCRHCLSMLLRSYRNAPLPGIRTAARADYDALAVQMDAASLHTARLPAHLP